MRALLSPVLSVGAFLALTLGSHAAHAYCRTTTCDPYVSCNTSPEDCCILDDDFCDTNGIPITWPSSCVSYNVQEDGSDLLDISAGELSNILKDAYDEWLTADCDGDPPTLSIDYRGKAVCDSPEFNEGGNDRNANIWMFNDSEAGRVNGDQFEVDATTLAVTLVSFNYKTAEIYDVDVELNSGIAAFTTADSGVDIDLASVVTHEAGHFLGLDHSKHIGATMAAGYSPGDITPRDISPDDANGICASYPLDRDITRNTCDPRGKYHEKCEGDGCDCRMAPGRAAPRGGWLAAAALGAIFLLRRRRAVRG